MDPSPTANQKDIGQASNDLVWAIREDDRPHWDEGRIVPRRFLHRGVLGANEIGLNTANDWIVSPIIYELWLIHVSTDHRIIEIQLDLLSVFCCETGIFLNFIQRMHVKSWFACVPFCSQWFPQALSLIYHFSSPIKWPKLKEFDEWQDGVDISWILWDWAIVW